jgi:hypothetical protein
MALLRTLPQKSPRRRPPPPQERWYLRRREIDDRITSNTMIGMIPPPQTAPVVFRLRWR